MNALVEAPAPRAVVEPTIIAGAAIRSLVPTSFEGVWRMAQVLAVSPFAPKGMNTPEACACAITLGLDLGITPIQAVQSIAVINNRPSIWGDLALALCLANPICEGVDEEIQGDGDKMVAVCTAKRKGSAKAKVGKFSVDQAKKANLWTKDGPWRQYPERMLQLRARAFALRDAFPDVLKGISIREEVEDIQVRDAAPPPPRPPSVTTLAPLPPGPQAEIEDATILSETAAGAPPPSQPAAPGAEASTSNPPAGEASASDTFHHDGINPDDEIGNLIDKLAHAKDEATVEEWYVETDIEAALSDFDGYVEKARGVREQHLQRVRKLAAAAAPADEAAPPAPPSAVGGLADDEDGEAGAPPAPAQEDRGFDLEGWRDLTTRHQYAGYADLLAAYAKRKGDTEIIATFWKDSNPLRTQLIPIAERAERTKIKERLDKVWAEIEAANAKREA